MHKVCIFLIHHLRKMADENDVFNMISGSNGIMGVCDTIYIIYKKKRQDENATLFMTGRDIRQQDIVLNFDEDKFRWNNWSARLRTKKTSAKSVNTES